MTKNNIRMAIAKCTRGFDARGLLSAAGWSVFAFTVVIQTAQSIELIQNGSFEDNRHTGHTNAKEWDDGAGVDSDIGFVVHEYPFGDCGDDWCSGRQDFITPGPPSSGVSGPIGRGRFYAGNFGNVNGDGGILGSATQHVQLIKYAGSAFEFSAWLTSTPFDTDYAIVSAEFFANDDATGDSLGTIEFDGNDQQSTFIAGSANEEGLADPTVPATKANWTLYRAIGEIPVNAASAAVVLRNGITGVNADNGYVDLVSLQVLSDPPEFLGDYNGNGKVEQSDLHLVLLHWGDDADPLDPFDGWIRNLASGRVDQADLDAVLLNWGNTQPIVSAGAAVPESASGDLFVALLPFVLAILRTQRRRTKNRVPWKGRHDAPARDAKASECDLGCPDDSLAGGEDDSLYLYIPPGHYRLPPVTLPADPVYLHALLPGSELRRTSHVPMAVG
jgi:hypothetical protein